MMVDVCFESETLLWEWCGGGEICEKYAELVI